MNATGLIRLTDKWDVSTRVSYLSGRPLTPIDAPASAAARRAIYDTARLNADRGPDYFRADVRVDRRLTWFGRAARLYGGVQNVTNRRNVAGYTWDRRNNVLKELDQLRLLPIVGLDWQF